MGADALSEVLRAVRLTGAVFFHNDLAGEWASEPPPARECIPYVMPGAQHLIEYHLVARGGCWAGLVDAAPIRLEAGDVIVFPQGDSHVVSSAPGLRGLRPMALFEGADATQLPFFHRFGAGGGEHTRLICGFLGCDAQPFNPLLAALPRMMHLRAEADLGDGNANGWLALLGRIALVESHAKRAGGEGVLARVSELMFIEAVRRHVETLPADQIGWLAGLRDRFVGRALNLLHGRPGFAWTLEQLAREVGLSRSAFAERFAHFVGQPPMQYLARWRMQVASAMLANGSDNVAQVAFSVGYESEAAFSRAFKRVLGAPPASWRKALS
jgi:AraC-like DNA-binding protein